MTTPSLTATGRNFWVGFCPERGVTGIINMGADLATSRTTLELTRRYDYVYGRRRDPPRRSQGSA